MSEGNFANGLIVKRPHQNAPGFVKCKLSFKVDEFIQCLQQNNNQGWVNMDIKLAKDNVKLYAEIDNWQPQQQPQQQPPQQQNQYQQQPPQNQNYQQPPYPQPGQPFQQQQAPPQQQQAPPPQNQQPPQQQYNSNAGFIAEDDIPF